MLLFGSNKILKDKIKNINLDAGYILILNKSMIGSFFVLFLILSVEIHLINLFKKFSNL